jgi:hypothetical protein
MPLIVPINAPVTPAVNVTAQNSHFSHVHMPIPTMETAPQLSNQTNNANMSAANWNTQMSAQRIPSAAAGSPNQVAGPVHGLYNLASAYQQFGLPASTTPLLAPPVPRPSAARATFGYVSQTIPDVTLVSPALRRSIVEGRDVNLSALLIPHFRGSGDNSERYPVDAPRDLRAPNKPLTIQQFVRAFTLYKDIMCEAFPHRSLELDRYLKTIVAMAERFPGPGFYDYHCQFSQQAAGFLRYYNQCVDWSVRNEPLYNDIFAGRPVNACSVCNSTSHTTQFCTVEGEPSAPRPKPFHTRREAAPAREAPNRPTATEAQRPNDVHGRPRVYHMGKEVCNNFNTDAGCRAPRCSRAHVCLGCKANHPKPMCPLEKATPSAQAK